MKSTSKLSTVVSQTLSAGALPVEAAARLFAADKRLKTNVIRICKNSTLVTAVGANVIVDHRAVSPLLSLNNIAARILLETEARLGRSLSHKRAIALVGAYQRIHAQRQSLEGRAMYLKEISLNLNRLKLAA